VTPRLKARADRASQRKKRGSKTSPVTDLEDALVVLAWEAGELTEGQAAAALGVDRLGARLRREALLARGITLAYELKKGRAKGGEG
jgi:predicted ArsR family transcriptional regulator